MDGVKNSRRSLVLYNLTNITKLFGSLRMMAQTTLTHGEKGLEFNMVTSVHAV